MQTPPQMPDFGQMGGGAQIIQGDASREAQARAQVLQAVNQLSLGIYSQLAIARLVTLDRPHQVLNPEDLRQLARDSHAAAQAYFEGLGIAQFKPRTDSKATNK